MSGELVREYENAALRAALENPSALSLVAKLQPDDFQQGMRRDLFESIVAAHKNGEDVDEITILDRFPHHNHLQAVMDAPSVPTNVKGYIDGIRKAGLLRRLSSELFDLQQQIDAGAEVSSILDSGEKVFVECRDRASQRGGSSGATLAQLDQQIREWWYSDTDELTMFKWPDQWPLNDLYGGYGPGQLLTVCGYTGDGKSVVGLQWFEKCLEDGHHAAYFSLEMPEQQVYRRLIAMDGIYLSKIRDRSSAVQDAVSDRSAALYRLNGTVYGGTTTIGRIKAEQSRHKYNVIFVDHLHRMPYRDRQELEQTVRGLKNLALDQRCAVVLLAQLSRRQEMGVPELSQLRDSAVIEQESDSVFAVYRKRKGDVRLDESLLCVLKMRDGAADKRMPLMFRPERMRFEYTPFVAGVGA